MIFTGGNPGKEKLSNSIKLLLLREVELNTGGLISDYVSNLCVLLPMQLVTNVKVSCFVVVVVFQQSFTYHEKKIPNYFCHTAVRKMNHLMLCLVPFLLLFSFLLLLLTLFTLVPHFLLLLLLFLLLLLIPPPFPLLFNSVLSLSRRIPDMYFCVMICTHLHITLLFFFFPFYDFSRWILLKRFLRYPRVLSLPSLAFKL